jgi:hypothetical protein
VRRVPLDAAIARVEERLAAAPAAAMEQVE